MYTHVQGKSKVIPQRAIRAYGRTELQLRPFLLSVIGGSNWSAGQVEVTGQLVGFMHCPHYPRE